MSRCGIAVLQVGLLLVCVPAYAVVKNALIRITVVDAETHSQAVEGSGVPKNCDLGNYDAYCHNSRTSIVTNTLLVQEGDQPPFRVSCTMQTRFSRCVPLPKGQSFDARREESGLSVYYVDDKGKLRHQLYTYVEGEPGAAKSATTTINSASATSAASATAAPSAGATTPAAVPPQTAPAAQSATATQETVKCSFSSTPPGAEVWVDGRYVGSTPSVLSLSTGNHTVEVSLPGFGQWKRELTVSPGSELTVNAVLEKAQ